MVSYHRSDFKILIAMGWGHSSAGDSECCSLITPKGLIPRTCIRQLTQLCNSSSRDWMPLASADTCTYLCKYKHRNKALKSIKDIIRRCFLHKLPTVLILWLTVLFPAGRQHDNGINTERGFCRSRSRSQLQCPKTIHDYYQKELFSNLRLEWPCSHRVNMHTPYATVTPIPH